jgi:cytochrome c5
MKKIILSVTVLVVLITACAKKSIEEIAPEPVKTPVVVAPNTPVAKTTYDADIKPIMNAQCVSCHGANAQYPDCSTYTAVKAAMDAANGETILTRMNLAVGDGKFMPKSGTKVQADVDKITKWQTDGLLEK